MRTCAADPAQPPRVSSCPAMADGTLRLPPCLTTPVPTTTNGRSGPGPALVETRWSVNEGRWSVDKFVVCQEGLVLSPAVMPDRVARCAIARSGIQTSVRLLRSDFLAHSNAGSARYFFCFSSITVLAARALICCAPDQRAALLHLSGVTAVGVAQCWNTFARHSRRSAAKLHGQIWNPDISGPKDRMRGGGLSNYQDRQIYPLTPTLSHWERGASSEMARVTALCHPRRT